MGTALATRLQGLNLYLVGMMGTGKSAVGRIVQCATARIFRFTLGNIAVEEGVGQGKAPFAMDGAAAIHGHIAIKHAAGDGQNA